MNLREYRPEDCKAIAELFYNTIHSVNLKDYTEQQAEAWAPKRGPDLDKWNDRFLQSYTVVVEHDNNVIGVGNMTDVGYFDFLYIHKDYQGQGIATLIANHLEDYGQSKKNAAFTTDASITAKPFFEHRGYVIVTPQTVEQRGQQLTNYKMKKTI